jgi:phosphoenolpyruvate-protein kinase (PTS system EI component)
MISRIYVSAVALAMLAAPAFAAESKCAAPIAPSMPSDGKAATAADMTQAAKDAVAFIKDSDQYQLCLKAALDDTEKQIKDIDPKHDKDGTERKALLAAQKDINTKADASQKEKERVGKAYNTAAAAYKSAHR